MQERPFTFVNPPVPDALLCVLNRVTYAVQTRPRVLEASPFGAVDRRKIARGANGVEVQQRSVKGAHATLEVIDRPKVRTDAHLMPPGSPVIHSAARWDTILIMRSVRLDPDLDERVRRAAEVEGSTVSEFIRNAITERTERTLSSRLSDRLVDVIGAVHTDGGRARRTGAAFTEAIVGGDPGGQ
jgi:hypothetical protein